MPVKLTKNRTKFLELKTRRLLPRARTKQCKKEEAVFYVKDKEGTYWRRKENNFKKVNLRMPFSGAR